MMAVSNCCRQSADAGRAVEAGFGIAFGDVAEARFFFDRVRFGKAAPQVYKQKLVYRIVVIVNDPYPLWISRLLFTRSNVYVPHKAVGRACMCLREKLDKISRLEQKPLSAQSVPVDMQTFIHSG